MPRSPANQPTTILYDGNCSVCAASAAKLNKLDKGRGRVITRDLNTADDYIQQHNLDPQAVRASMHAITPDGRVLTAMDALRHTLSALGRGWMLAWTRIPGIRWIADRAYHWFARNRSWLAPKKHTCSDGSCSINR